MRTELKKLANRRCRFVGTYQATIDHWNWKGEAHDSVLLTNIYDTEGELLTGHTWIQDTFAFGNLRLHKGHRISFIGEVQEYMKGCRGMRRSQNNKKRSVDYTVGHISDVSIIGFDSMPKKQET